MQSVTNFLNRIWTYTINHKWSKDILRGNLLFIFLIIIYDLFHFSMAVVTWGLFFKFWLLLNICYLFKLLLDVIM